MKKKIKKYISGSMVAALLLTAIPSQIVAGTMPEDDSNVMEADRVFSSGDEILENIEIINNEMETDNDQEESDVLEKNLSVNEASDFVSRDTVIYDEEKEDSNHQIKEEETGFQESATTNEWDNGEWDDEEWDDDITESFTDLYFRSTVREALGLSKNEPITKDICSEITELNVYVNEKTKSLEGIEYLKNLKILNCLGCQLTKLDLSSCTKLTYLNCAGNQLTELNVSKCIKLTHLYCDGNQLTELDISNCSKLLSLGCSENRLRSLNITGCPKLAYLMCSGNRLSALNIKKCPQLSQLFCDNNNMSSPANIIGKNKEFDIFAFAPQKTAYIKTNSIKLYLGGKAKTLKVYKTKSKVTYKSSNPKIVRVDSKGTIIPKSIGKATISIKIAGINASPKVNVTVSGRDVTSKYKAKTQKVLRNFDQYFGYCCGKGATFKYDVYARTNMLSIPNLHKIYGKSTKYAKNKLSREMKLFFGTSTVKFKKFSGYYKWRKDPSNIVVSKNGKVEYTSGNWGYAVPRGKVTKVIKTEGKKFIVTYKVYRYNGYEKKVEYDMGIYEVTLKKANNKNGFIITNMKRTQTNDVLY